MGVIGKEVGNGLENMRELREAEHERAKRESMRPSNKPCGTPQVRGVWDKDPKVFADKIRAY